ncbi:MAG: AAA family ATPase, partial [Desulfamplus sp.]|nr:AAA family ATPase [Desulfamplus sp.]
KWDWSRKFPVIKIDFADGTLKNREELDRRIWNIMRNNAERLGVKYQKDQYSDIPGCMADIIEQSVNTYGLGVVVLIDEYDKPILDNIENPDIALEMREGLKNLYSVFKGQDAKLQFVFMTGVSKFSKVSLFSGINQLRDITISSDFAAICGYTQSDLELYFVEHLQGVDREKLKQWYNGYQWLGEAVYNPYDILLFISDNFTYRNYWFETGSPDFLIKIFKQKRYFLPDLEKLELTEEILESFDIEKINPLTLLFQTGYLTIQNSFTKRGRLIFAMKIPNMEVKIALNDQFINAYTDMVNEKIGIQDSLYSFLEKGDVKGVVGVIKRLFASIPYRNFTGNNLIESEGYYASVLYAFFSSLDAKIIPEDVTNHGQVDMTVMLRHNIYVVEIKVVEGSEIDYNPALEQIQKMKYSEKYIGNKYNLYAIESSSKKEDTAENMGVYELGLVFSKKERNIIRADWNQYY